MDSQQNHEQNCLRKWKKMSYEHEVLENTTWHNYFSTLRRPRMLPLSSSCSLAQVPAWHRSVSEPTGEAVAPAIRTLLQVPAVSLYRPLLLNSQDQASAALWSSHVPSGGLLPFLVWSHSGFIYHGLLWKLNSEIVGFVPQKPFLNKTKQNKQKNPLIGRRYNFCCAFLWWEGVPPPRCKGKVLETEHTWFSNRNIDMQSPTVTMQFLFFLSLFILIQKESFRRATCCLCVARTESPEPKASRQMCLFAWFLIEDQVAAS